MNGTTPLAIISADPSDAPPAANQAASRRGAPVRSMTRASVTPPPIIASTLSSVPKDPPTASVTSASGASSTANPTMSAPIIPATGGTQAGNRDSKSATTTNSGTARSEEHTSELQSRGQLVCRLLLEKNKKNELPTPSAATNADW